MGWSKTIHGLEHVAFRISYFILSVFRMGRVTWRLEGGSQESRSRNCDGRPMCEISSGRSSVALCIGRRRCIGVFLMRVGNIGQTIEYGLTEYIVINSTSATHVLTDATDLAFTATKIATGSAHRNQTKSSKRHTNKISSNSQGSLHHLACKGKVAATSCQPGKRIDFEP